MREDAATGSRGVWAITGVAEFTSARDLGKIVTGPVHVVRGPT